MDDDKCLLCRVGKLYQIKSHLTPAGITENTYGERNKELIYTIDPEKKTIDKYYGRDHPQTETTEIKDAPNSRKGIFCKECEIKLGNYESEVQDKLNALINSLGKGGYKIHRTNQGIKYLEIDIHQNILIPFFQSVVWRQSIEQVLDNMDCPLNADNLELLRKTVLENISISTKEITKIDLSNNPNISIFTTYNTDSADVSSFVNPSPTNSNPLLFFVGLVNLLYWADKKVTDNFTEKTKITSDLLTDELNLNKSRIAIVSSADWTKINYQLAKSVARKFNS